MVQHVCVCVLLFCFEGAHTSDDETCQTRILKSINSLIIYSATAYFTAVYRPWNSNPSDLYGKSSYCHHPQCPFINISVHFKVALFSTDMRRLTTGKCVVRRFRRRANVIQCNYTNLDSIELFHQPTLMHNFLYSLTTCLLHYYPRHVSSINMPIFRRKNYIHTASGIIALCKRLHSTLVESSQSVYCADVYRER